MSLHFGWRDELLFRSWAPMSIGEYFGCLFLVFLISLLYQFLSSLHITKSSLAKKSLKEVYLKEIIILRIALLKTFIILLEYFLVLIVVTGNVGYLVSILSGHFLGLLMF